MNRKGFTLVELLATLVVLSIVMGISIVGILGSLENTKKKTEKEFLTQLSNSVDAYVTMCISKYNTNRISCQEFVNFPSMSNSLDDEYKYGVIVKSGNRSVNVYKSLQTINFNNILNENILVENDLVNPVNGISCKDGATITFYRDYDFVYYYDINLPSSCIKYPDDNSNVISTLLNVNVTANAGRSSMPDDSSSIQRQSTSLDFSKLKKVIVSSEVKDR